MIKIAIVDDQKIFRDGIKLILSDEPDIEVVSESINGAEFIKKIDEVNADVILMDIDMPVMNGIETTQKALKIRPGLNILTLSMYGEEGFYYKMIHAGVKGFIIKEADSKELKEAIVRVSSGNNYFSKELLRKVFSKFETKITPKDVDSLSFSSEEVDLFKLITKGYSELEIAAELNTKVDIISERIKNLNQKTKTSDISNLIMYAIKNNIVEIY